MTMRTSLLMTPPLARLTPRQRLALGSALAAVGGAIIVLSLLLGWNELPRPWSFLVGLAAGLTGGIGVPLAVCGLLHCGPRALRSDGGTRRNPGGRR
jgi:hypothetical protein